ncbi:Protein of unknown function [Actinopolyspora lacussalsi subsp. righensis]|uniref:DUF3558 domain-containing protein n=2 Tax=Actinopolyspora righensis TaxID=995060 RepID=A0A1I7A6K2_9ACTN|nr:Protein of unknown function [Actinopolyspora righensis]
MPRHSTTTRATLLVTLATGSFLLLSACSGNSTGEDAGSTKDTTTSTEPALAQINPCEQITPANKENLKIEKQGEKDEIVGAPTCSWQTSNGSLILAFHPDKGIEELNFSDGEEGSYSVSGEKGKIVRGNTGDNCSVTIPFSESSSVNIGARVDDIPSSCELAKRAAPMVWENLSKQS